MAFSAALNTALNATLNATMRGVIFEGIPREVRVIDVPVPVILNETDAIVRITTSAICGSDLHMYHGVRGGPNPPWVVGHEAMGYISEIGSAVHSLSVGDYVVIPDNLDAGHLQMDPEPRFGHGGPGNLGGLQAEYARVPFADDSLIPVPLTAETTNSSIEQDYVLLSDIFATGWTVLDFAGFQPGDTIAVFGAGPVGLLAAYSATLRGASKVYSVDHVPQRLEKAASIGAIPINFFESDPVQQILAYEPAGVIRAVDCVGMEAINAQGELQEDIVIQNLVAVTRQGGGIGQVGVFITQHNSAGAPLAETISPNISFPLSDFFSKGLHFGAGVVDPKRIAPVLEDLITSGRAHPNFVGTNVISIEEVPEYFRLFDSHEVVKVYINFP
ncbi:putative alcohol dehydrogenase superfamily zinc-containing protein [Neofusicoccum parvum UCRNP2]|uniref:Putative alcohol dehydrogenase superfamily zinc-containing protein n=1 Tax=Botryosphaeria parva (strain UCR-NP2) TaxID=1287680 RepID=R1G3C0_BOTPV|nr:putative alcohol dehydrogenase superfamily zinc-containing protein [Neofusicoccum parvum UCRNP2]